ncbi:MAG: hypothetical protein WAU32_01145, partial [Thermoanaerobaculia bacterium]
YRATVTAGGARETREFRILPDPRLKLTAEDYARQLDLMLAMRASLDAIYDGVRACRSVRDQARAAVARLKEAGANVAALETAAGELSGRLTAIENELMQTKNEADQDVENFPTKLDNQLAYVYGLVGETDARPTDGQVERYADIKKELDPVLERLRRVVAEDVAAFNRTATAAGAAPIIPPK